MSRGSPIELEFRRSLRRDATDAEWAIWWIVRNRHLGAKFRRQHSVGPFTLDFYCAELRLAIELDGGQHYEEPGRRYDASRDAVLCVEGVRTLRFSNLDVLKETEGVAEVIWNEVQRLRAERARSAALERRAPLRAPSPSLSPEVSGERCESAAQRHIRQHCDASSSSVHRDQPPGLHRLPQM